MGTADRCRHVAGYVAGHIDEGCVAAIDHVHLVVLDLRLVGPHLAYLADVVRLAHDGHLRAACKGHLACLCRRVLVGHAAYADVQRLCLCRQCDEHGG